MNIPQIYLRLENFNSRNMLTKLRIIDIKLETPPEVRHCQIPHKWFFSQWFNFRYIREKSWDEKIKKRAKY